MSPMSPISHISHIAPAQVLNVKVAYPGEILERAAMKDVMFNVDFSMPCVVAGCDGGPFKQAIARL